MNPVRAHDLLRIAGPERLRGDEPRPAWADDALARAPWVVARRAPSDPPWIAVGVRGAERQERWAAWADLNDVIERLRPVDLIPRLTTLAPERLAAAPALAAAAALAAAWRDRAEAPAWGPTGSVGFELASGRPTARPASDLDAVIVCPQPVSVAEASGWLAAFDKAASPATRCDVLLETPMGGVALLEYVRAAPPVVLRTAAGPKLAYDPWRSLA